MEQTTNLSPEDYASVLQGDDGLIVYLEPKNTPYASIKSSNLSRSKFLQLPAEVRLRIYHFSLVSPATITVWSAWGHYGHYQPTHKLN